MIEFIAKETAIRFANFLHTKGFRPSIVEGVLWTSDKTTIQYKTEDLYDEFIYFERERLDEELK